MDGERTSGTGTRREEAISKEQSDLADGKGNGARWEHRKATPRKVSGRWVLSSLLKTRGWGIGVA